MRFTGSLKPIDGNRIRLGQIIPVKILWDIPAGTLGTVRVGEPFSNILPATADNGSTVTFSVSNGTLPAGVTLNPVSGIISGVPTGDGLFVFTIRASAGLAQAERPFSIRANPFSITWATDPALGSLNGGDAYFKQLSATASTGVQPTYAITGGSLPPGLALSNSGALSGTVTNLTGNYTFTVQASVPGNATKSTRTFTVSVVADAITWATPAGSLGVVPGGRAFSTALNATSGFGKPVTYQIVMGTLPLGLTLSTGTISGTVTNNSGTSSITVRATDGIASADRVFSISVDPDILTWTTPSSLGQYIGGALVNQKLVAVSDNGETVTYARVSGTLPAGLSFDSAGNLTGNLGNLNSSGSFVIRASDPVTFTDRTFSFSVKANTVDWNTSPAVLAVVNTPFSKTLKATSSIGNPVTYALQSGVLPTGVTLTSAGVLSGTTTAFGVTNFTVRATDGTIFSDLAAVFTSNAPPVWSTPVGSIGTVEPGAYFSYQLTATDPDGTIANYTYANTNLLGASVTLTTSGLLSGSFGYPSPENAPTWVTAPGSLANLTDGDVLNAQFTATPFSGRSVRYVIAVGNTPSGFNLNPNTGTVVGLVSSDNTKAVESELLLTPAPSWVSNGIVATGDEGSVLSTTLVANPLLGNAIASYDVIDGVLPWGLSLLANSGTITGTVADQTPYVDVPFLYTPTWVTQSGSLVTVNEGGLIANTVQATSGTSAMTYSITTGSLPGGTALTPNTGLIMGLADASTFFGIDGAETLLTPRPLWTTNAALSSANESDAFTAVLGATPRLGNAITSYDVVAGILPWGISLNSANGAVTGTILDQNPVYDPSRVLNGPVWTTPTGTIANTVEFSSLNLNVVASAYNGGLSYTIANGAIPGGTTLVSNTGAIIGMAETSTFVGVDGPELLLTPVPMWTSNVALGTVNEVGPFVANLSATPMLGNVITSYDVVAGAMPWGLSLLGNGSLTGSLVDQNPIFDPSANMNPPVWQTNSGTIANAVEYATVNTTVKANAYLGSPVSYTISAGTIPGGTTLVANTGVISGLAETSAFVGIDGPELLLTPTPMWTTGAALGTIDEALSFTANLSATPMLGNVITAYDLISGAMPWGLALLGNGSLIGTLADQNAVTDPSANANPPTWVTNSGTIANAVEFSSVSATVKANAYLGSPVTYTIASGAIPGGTTLSANTGVLTGLAEASTYVGLDGPETLLTPAPSWVSSAALPDANEGDVLSIALAATPLLGNAIASYDVIGGNMPFGLSLNTANGAVTGAILDQTPFLDPNQFANTPVWVTPAGSIGTFANGSTVSQTFQATPRVGTPSYALATGVIPVGLVFTPNTGTIAGTLDVDAAGRSYAFTVRAFDGSGVYTDRAFSATVSA